MSKKFIAIFSCAENSENHRAWMKLSSDEQKVLLEKGYKAMDNWSEKFGHKIVFKGSDLGSKTMKVSAKGIEEVGSAMGGFFIVEASSQIEAGEMFINHPHFTIFPGDSVDILECVDDKRLTED